MVTFWCLQSDGMLVKAKCDGLMTSDQNSIHVTRQTSVQGEVGANNI